MFGLLRVRVMEDPFFPFLLEDNLSWKLNKMSDKFLLQIKKAGNNLIKKNILNDYCSDEEVKRVTWVSS